MANTFLKPTVIISGLLGLLEREVVLPGLVTRDAAVDFSGAANDTVSLRVPAYVAAESRTLRAGTPITFDEDLTETKVDVVLNKDIHSPKAVTDEQLTLDIADFAEQVLSPMVRATARGVEESLATTITGATYANTVEFDNTTPYDTVVDARKLLNDANVPMGGRALLLGSSLEAQLLKADQFARVDYSGSDSALRDAMLGRIAGFDVYTSNAIPPDEGYAFHRSAFVLATRAPVAPEGATWSASQTFAGIAMRVLRDYDAAYLRDRIITNVYVGSAAVTDEGAFDGDGIFVPDSDETAKLVRAVKITDASS